MPDVPRQGAWELLQEVFLFTPKMSSCHFTGHPAFEVWRPYYISSRWCSSRCCGSLARHVERNVKQMPTDTRRHNPKSPLERSDRICWRGMKADCDGMSNRRRCSRSFSLPVLFRGTEVPKWYRIVKCFTSRAHTGFLLFDNAAINVKELPFAIKQSTIYTASVLVI